MTLARILLALWRIERKLHHMDQTEAQAFSDLNTKADALVAVTEQVLTVLVDVKSKLDAATGDPAEVVAAAASVSAKLDSEIAKAQAALAAVSPAPAPEAPPAA